jgi:hypothetical protein
MASEATAMSVTMQMMLNLRGDNGHAHNSKI